MQVRELEIPNVWVFTPTVHRDPRGEFHEFYRVEQVEAAVGRPLVLRQGNSSVSSRGVLRGVHYALVPPGQAKYVTAVRGSFIDFIVDVRVGSPTFGKWEAVAIDDIDHRAIYLAEGLGHALLALSEYATVNYLVSEVYNPERERSLNPLDPGLGLDFSAFGGEPLLSLRDASAPGLAEAAAAGLLPNFDECRAFYATSHD